MKRQRILILSVLWALFLTGCASQTGESENLSASAVRKVDLSRGIIAAQGAVKIERVGEAGTESTKRRVLIYHTHTYEAYMPDEDEPYEKTQEWRSADPKWNVTAVGEELALQLRMRGFDVVHDDTAFEPPDLDQSYARSLEALENYRARGEKFDLYIDLHRDAYSGDGSGKNTVTIRGGEAARVMVLIGNGKGTWQGRPFDEKPQWEKNFSYAQSLTDKINEIAPGMAKNVTVKTGRYNQHISPKAILLEAGNHYNSLEEAKLSMSVVARAIAALN